jgi:hypothetical protein
MSERYDVLAVRKFNTRDGEEKSMWTNVGVAFSQKDGKGFSINLHCVPVPDKESGEIRLVMRVPMPKEDRGGGGGRSGPRGGGGGGGYGPPSTGDDADQIPFAPLRGECI